MDISYVGLMIIVVNLIGRLKIVIIKFVIVIFIKKLLFVVFILLFMLLLFLVNVCMVMIRVFLIREMLKMIKYVVSLSCYKFLN